MRLGWLVKVLVLVPWTLWSIDRPKMLTTYTDITLGNTLRDRERADFKSNASVTVIPSYRVSGQTTLGFRVTANKHLTNKREFGLSTAYFSATQKIATLGKNDFITFSTTGRILLPVNENQRDETTFRGGAYIRPRIAFDLPFLKYTFRPSYSESFYRFKTFNGVVNNRRTLSLFSTLEFQVTEKIGWNVLFGQNERWNFRGSRSETYVVDSAISFTLSEKADLSVGYSVEAPTRTVTGKNNIKLYDNENGEAYLTLAYIF